MKPHFYIHVFAVISIVALSLHIFSTFWVPLIIGFFVTLVLAYLFRK